MCVFIALWESKDQPGSSGVSVRSGTYCPRPLFYVQSTKGPLLFGCAPQKTGFAFTKLVDDEGNRQL